MNNVEKEIKIADIIAKKLVDEELLTEEELLLLGEWLDESEEHRQLLLRHAEGRSLEEFEGINRLTDRDKQWQRLDRGIGSPRAIGWRSWSAYAAGVVLLLSLGVWIGLKKDVVRVSPVVEVAVIDPGTSRAMLILEDGQQIVLEERDTLVKKAYSDINVRTGEVRYDQAEKKPGNPDVVYNTIVVPRGGIYSLVLSDGTRVFLNSESELRYPVPFSGELREVSLKGEAFFEVVKDTGRPFIVEARSTRTRVLGTSFNVSAYADEPEVQTTLLSGRVEVSVDGTSLKAVLNPGTRASWEVGTDEITTKEVNVKALWRDGIIVMDDDGLESVMRMLSRWYNVTYEFCGDRGARHTFTGKIDRNEDLGSVLETLTLLGGPRFEIVGTVVHVY